MTAYIPHDTGLYVPEYAANQEEVVPEMQSYRWTPQNTLETDPDGIDPIHEVSPGDYELAADSDVWKTGEGRKAARNAIPDPDKVAAMRRVAGRLVQMQNDDSLVQAMTEDEYSEARGLARQRRETQRQHDHEMQQFDLNEEKAEAEHAQSMRQRNRRTRERIADARERQERATDPSYRLVVLSKLATWLPLAALIPGVLSIALGASNAATELNRINPATTWMNWVIEPMFSIGVIVILIAQWLGAVPSALHSLKEAGAAQGLGAKLKAAASNGFFVMELLLFAATVVLQVGTHYIGTGAKGGSGPLVWFAVPFGLLISMALVPAVSARLNAALSAAMTNAEKTLSETAENGGFSTGSDLRGKKDPEEGENQGENPTREEALAAVPSPAQRSKAEARTEFFAMVNRGEIDPENDSVNTVAKKLGTRWGNASEFLKEWKNRN